MVTNTAITAAFRTTKRILLVPPRQRRANVPGERTTVESEDTQSAQQIPLMVVHACWHVQRYFLPGSLGEEARRDMASELCKEECPACAQEAGRGLASYSPAAA